MGIGLMLSGAAVAAQEPAPQVSGQAFWVEQLASGLNAPWGMAWLPDGTLLITEKFGGLRVFRNGALTSEPLPGGPQNVYQAAQSGLLDIVLDPDFDKNQRLFIAYTEGTADRKSVV